MDPTMDRRPVVFISHLGEEKEVALALKTLLQDHLGARAQIFVSSDDVSIEVGEKWLDSVSRHLKSCVVEIILCSPAAMDRHWIHFEAGAGWIRDILVMPVCFAGMTARNLPDPLRQLQAVDAGNPKDVSKLIRAVARAVKVTIAKTKCKKFVKLIEEIDARRASGPVFPKIYQVSADIQADLPELIRTTKKSLVMSGIHFNISLGNRFTDYANALGSGIALTICALRPESAAVDYLAEYSGYPAECQLTLTFFDRLKRAHQAKPGGKGSPGTLSLKLSDRAPVGRAYLFDHPLPTGQLLYTPYLRLRDSTDCPTLLFHKNQAVFSAFVESTLHHIDGATDY